jgi:hypothetical protein
MVSVFGPDAEETVEDPTWLERAGREKWVVLTKDKRIRRKVAELAAVRAYGVKVFHLSAKDFTGPQQRDRLLNNIHRIVQRSRKPGPWICTVYAREVMQVWP